MQRRVRIPIFIKNQQEFLRPTERKYRNKDTTSTNQDLSPKKQ